MDTSFIAPGIGAAIGIGITMMLMNRRKAQLSPGIEKHLRERGTMTLPELQTALGMEGFYNRGKVVMALGALVQEGKIEESTPPPGTKMTEMINVRTYRWK